MNLLGFLNVRGGLNEVALLFVQQTQLVEGERDQVVVVPDATLAANRHRSDLYRQQEAGGSRKRPGYLRSVLPGENLCEAELSLKQPAQMFQAETLQHLDQAAVIWVELGRI